MYVTGSFGHIFVKSPKSNLYGILILILLKCFFVCFFFLSPLQYKVREVSITRLFKSVGS